MNKSEVLYERNITTSYMKLPGILEESIDLRIMLHHPCKGTIPVERCFVNGEGQFWYDISGKQAVDKITRVGNLEYSVFERIILRICEQIEFLEWNLLDPNGLLLDPEFIFLSKKEEEVSFVFYPANDAFFIKELQKLIEYLLTKLDHSDYERIQGAYEIYELTLQEEFQVQELKERILNHRIAKKNNEKEMLEAERIAENEIFYKIPSVDDEEKDIHKTFLLEEKLLGLYHKAKEIFSKGEKEEIPIVTYPREEEYIEKVVHPTICITASMAEPQGILLYEGRENYKDIELEKKSCIIGKGSRAGLKIERETISSIHAKIEYCDGYYIEDLNSTNGTFVNEEILNYKESKLLSSGDCIRFADVKYRFL